MSVVGSQYRSAPESLSFSLLDLDRLMLDASPDPDEESVSY
jgi:hypothetical protein